MPEGTVMSIGFTIEGQGFLALNGGRIFNFGGAISSRSTAMTKKKSVIAGKNYPQTGKKMYNNVDGWSNQNKANAVMKAMLQMKKTDIATLPKAYDGH